MSSAKDTRGTDPLDHLRLSCSEGNVVATKVAKASYDYAKAEIDRLTAENTRLVQALNAAVAGKPIGPVVGACTIVEQELDIRRLTAEVERLRARCGRLAAEVNAWRAADAASMVLQPRTNMGFVLNKLQDARAACDTHNDLKEPTDG